MDRKKLLRWARDIVVITAGCALFGLGFDLFLQPNQINVGGMSGVGQIISHLTGFGSVAFWTFLINVPLFLLGLKSIGQQFFIGSLLGMLLSNLFLELFSGLPVPQTEPLLAVLYGGLLSGLGLGMIFAIGASTGGSDILSRLLRPKFPNLPIGKIMLAIDAAVVILTGIVFQDINKTLYSAVCIYISSVMLDTVVYGMDYSTVALIISDHHDEIGKKICEQMERGVTILDGRGFYSGKDKQVLLSAIKKKQVAELKQIVIDVDPDAFIILQDAHQVLGDGFKRYNKNDL